MVLISNIGINRYRYVWRIVLIVLVLTGFSFLWPDIQYSVDVVRMYRSQSAVTIGLTLHEIDTKDIPNLDLNVWERQYLARDELPLSLVSLDYIYVPEELISDNDSLCVAEIKIFSTFTLGTMENVIYSLNENTDHQDICFAGGKNIILPKYFQITPIVYSNYHNPFFYPFDFRTIKYSVSSQLYFKSTGENLDADTKILMSVSPPYWTSNTNVISQSEEQKSLRLSTTISRPSLVKVLSIIVPFSVLLIILILPKIRNEIGSFWEVIVGLILGLWGLSEVLIPPYIDYPTIIETIILFLYIIIGLFIIFSVLNQTPQRNRPLVDLNSLVGEIPNNASIENLFVWAIEKINDGVESTKVAEALFVKASDVNSSSYKNKLIEVGEKFIKS